MLTCQAFAIKHACSATSSRESKGANTLFMVVASAVCRMGFGVSIPQFLEPCAGTPQNLRPATAVYIKAAVVDWAREPFIYGAYSYPTLGEPLHHVLQ